MPTAIWLRRSISTLTRPLEVSRARIPALAPRTRVVEYGACVVDSAGPDGGTGRWHPASSGYGGHCRLPFPARDCCLHLHLLRHPTRPLIHHKFQNQGQKLLLYCWFRNPLQFLLIYLPILPKCLKWQKLKKLTKCFLIKTYYYY